MYESEKVPFQFPRVLAWEVTRRCPLRCRHCRAAATNIPYENELTTQECQRVIDSLAAGRPPMIIWTGGEPMLRPDIDLLVTAAASRGIRSVMAPCGTLVTEARMLELKKAGITACSFSLDGPDAASHDAFRKVPGAYDHVTRAMAAARSVGMPFQVNTTVSTLNIDRLDEIYDRACTLGAVRLDVFFLVPVGRGKSISDCALSEDQTQQVLTWCFNKALSGPLGIKETCCPAAPALWQRLHPEAVTVNAQAPHNAHGHNPCGCLGGRGFAFLSHVGDLQTCGFIDTPCGNVRDFDCDFRALIAAAVNPLGARGTCRGMI